MSKYTKEINAVVERFNSLNPTNRIVVGHRNGYAAIDFVNNGNNFDAGLTDKECLHTLYVMCRTLDNFRDNSPMLRN